MRISSIINNHTHRYNIYIYIIYKFTYVYIYNYIIILHVLVYPSLSIASLPLYLPSSTYEISIPARRQREIARGITQEQSRRMRRRKRLELKVKYEEPAVGSFGGFQRPPQ